MHKPFDHLIRKFRFGPIKKNLPSNFKILLDLGCGARPWFFDGEFKETLQDVESFGLDRADFSFSNVPVGLKFNFVRYELKNTLPFGNEKFDLVTALALIEHLEEPESLLKEIRRILKPTGVLLLTMPTKAAKPILEFLAFKLHLIGEESIADHKRYFDKKMLARMLQATGFTIDRLFYFELGCNLFTKARK